MGCDLHAKQRLKRGGRASGLCLDEGGEVGMQDKKMPPHIGAAFNTKLSDLILL
jgi:hypothetical protein